MTTRPRKPVGAKRRWRDGHARKLDQDVINTIERELRQGIAARLAETLRVSDIAMTELAAALGVDRSNVVKWASGRKTPSLTRLVTICWALRRPLFDLLPDVAAGHICQYNLGGSRD